MPTSGKAKSEIGIPAGATASSYLWQVPGKRVSVRLSLAAIERIRIDVTEGFHALPTRGLETGGLLLGRVKRRKGVLVVDIEDYEAVECEHAAGPSYLLSAIDRKVLEERIRARRSGGLSIVGFYRSHTRKDFFLSLEDVYLMSAYFSAPSNVFLLIQSQREGPPTAGFATWEERGVFSMTPSRAFPFQSADLLGGGYEIRVETSAARGRRDWLPQFNVPKLSVPKLKVPQLKMPPLSMPQFGATAADAATVNPLRKAVLAESASKIRSYASIFRKPLEWWPRLKTPWLGAAAITATAILLVIASLVGILSRRTVPAAASLRLGLHVAREGDRIRLMWDPGAAAESDSAQAVVSIDDGFTQEKLNIDHNGFTQGSVVYWPRTGNLSFRMEVFAPGLIGSESLKPADFTLPGETVGAPQPDVAISTPSAEGSPVSTPSGVPFRRNVKLEASSVKPRRSLALDNSVAAAAPVMPVLPDAPAITARPAAAADAPFLHKSEVLTPPMPSIGMPFVSVAIDPVLDVNRGSLLRKLPLVGKHSQRTDYVPPALMAQAPTNVPAEMRDRIRHVVAVDVKVYVDRTGKVEYAELLSSGTGADRDLASLAVFSSRRWKFSPARLGDETVPGEVVLRYRFSPTVH